MSAFTTEERIALLLSILGKEVADATMRELNPTRANYIQRLVKDYQANPPSEEETSYVLDDFLKYFHFALRQLEPEIKDSAARAAGEEEAARKTKQTRHSKITYFPKLVPGRDPVADLNQLDPYQIAVALGNDHPKTVALVLSRLEPQLAADALAEISAEIRNDAIVFMSRESTVPAMIEDKVMRSTLEKALTVEYRAHQVEQTQILADLMRSVPKKLRGELLGHLEETDEDFCAEVKKKLYIFEDIGRLDDRDIQKMLGEIQTDFLIVGLQKASQELTDKLLGNLSKRARQSVQEEMQYRTNATEDEIEAARVELTAVLARLDEAGEVSLN